MSENFNGAGLTLIHNDSENYSILFAKSNSNKPNKINVWIFAGGKRNDGENPSQTAYREFVEEIFNVVVDIKIIDEIIEIISSRIDLYPIDSKISNNSIIPSYTFLQSSNAITVFVNVLEKHGIRSDVFPFGYGGLYNNKKEVNIFNFCSQRRYINDEALFGKNELVFITMIPLSNLIFTIARNKEKNKGKYGNDVYHYHGENLKIHVPSTIKYISSFLDTLNKEKPPVESVDTIESIVNIMIRTTIS